MHVYLVQHGEAIDKTIDPDRPLSDLGTRDAAQIGHFLQQAHVVVATIWHSGKTRARQTAEALAKYLGQGGRPIEKAALAPNDPVQPIYAELARAEEDVMIVGHLPHLAKLASQLLVGTDNAEPVKFQNAGVLCLERVEHGHWRIRWMLVPVLLRR